MQNRVMDIRMVNLTPRKTLRKILRKSLVKKQELNLLPQMQLRRTKRPIRKTSRSLKHLMRRLMNLRTMSKPNPLMSSQLLMATMPSRRELVTTKCLHQSWRKELYISSSEDVSTSKIRRMCRICNARSLFLDHSLLELRLATDR